MSILEKTTDFIGKCLLICLGILTTLVSFTSVFHIHFNLPIVIMVTVFSTLLFLLTAHIKHKYWVMIVIAVILAGCIILFHNELKIGILECANHIIEVYNKYFSTSIIGTFSVKYTNDLLVKNANQACTLLLVFVVLEYAYILVTATWYKIYPSIHILISLVFVISGMLLGRMPNACLMSLLIFYYFACIIFKGNRRIYLGRLGILGGVFLLSLGIILLFNNPSDYSATKNNEKYKKRLDTVVKKMNLDNLTIKSITNVFKNHTTVSGGVNGGKLGDADEIKFTGKIMLKTTLDTVARNEIYLKGYVAYEYEEDNWQMISQTHISEYYNYFDNYKHAVVDPFTYSYNFISALQKPAQNIKVENKNESTKYIYYPYFSDIKVKRSDYDLKPVTDNKTIHSYEFYDMSYNELINYYSNETSNTQGEWDYVSKVALTIPKDVRSEFNTLFADAPRYEGTKESMQACLDYVKKYLDDNTKYSLKPGKIEKDEDYVLDFLTERKMGYCTAYASSAVLIYRYMGIPSRYVEGYVITKSDMKNVKPDRNGQYEISLKDSSAHAWAEVFIPSVGYVPVENTPGYSSIEYTTSKENTSTQATTKSNPTTKESTQTPPSTTPNQTTSVVKTSKAGIKQEGSENDKNIFMIYGILATIALIFLGSILVYKRKYGNNRRTPDYHTANNRENILVLQEIYKEELLKYSVTYRIDQSNDDILKNILSAYAKMQSKLTDEQKQHFVIPTQEYLEKVLKIFKKAKYANESAQFSDEEYEFIRQYVEEFKNSLQYAKNRL